MKLFQLRSSAHELLIAATVAYPEGLDLLCGDNSYYEKRTQWIDIILPYGTYPVASLVRQRIYDSSQGSYLHALAASLLPAHTGGLCAVVRQVRVVEVVETEHLVDG